MIVQNGISSAPKQYLPPVWNTERVCIRDSQKQDVPNLTEIFNACNYAEPWDPTFYIVEQDELTGLVERSMADTGEDRGFRLQCLVLGATGKLIGYFHLQHHSPRLPQPATAFISMFVITPEHQGRRYAQEVVEGLSKHLVELGYIAIWLDVYLKNWPAIRFWVKQGFDTIKEFEGASQLSETAHAALLLEKRLKDA